MLQQQRPASSSTIKVDMNKVGGKADKRKKKISDGCKSLLKPLTLEGTDPVWNLLETATVEYTVLVQS